MSVAPWPHRVSFVAPVLRLSRTDEPLAVLAAGFLAVLLFENLVRHPVLGLTDVDDTDLDDDGKLLNAGVSDASRRSSASESSTCAATRCCGSSWSSIRRRRSPADCGRSGSTGSASSSRASRLTASYPR